MRSNIATTEDAGNGGVHARASYQYVGSSEVGYYRINYYAMFYYYTDAAYQINYVTSVTDAVSSSPTVMFEQSHFPGYYLYTYNYAEISKSSSLTTENQIGMLVFNGTASFSCTYNYLGFTAPVSGASEGVLYNSTVFSSTFPKTIVP